jgi:hypothetical protein
MKTTHHGSWAGLQSPRQQVLSPAPVSSFFCVVPLCSLKVFSLAGSLSLFLPAAACLSESVVPFYLGTFLSVYKDREFLFPLLGLWSYLGTEWKKQKYELRHLARKTEILVREFLNTKNAENYVSSLLCIKQEDQRGFPVYIQRPTHELGKFHSVGLTEQYHFIVPEEIHHKVFFFIHMCIQCLGHFSPLPLHPPLLPCPLPLPPPP